MMYGQSPTTHPHPRLRVLVVDDSHDGAEMLQLLLEQLGCEVTAVHSGDSALGVAPTVRPDLVLLDIGMPGMDGYETCERLRQTAGGDAMSIVALTGWGQEEDRARSTRAGFDLHLVKPVEVDLLARIVRECPVGARGITR